MRWQQCRSDQGWASVELAIITPALLFLVSILATLLGVAAQRVNFNAALHDVAVAAARLAPSDQLTAQAASQLAGFSHVEVSLVPDGQQAEVRLSAEIALPHPLSKVALHWSDAVTIARGW